MPASNYLQRQALNAFLRGTEPTIPSTCYLALYTTNPGASDSGTEVNGINYERVPVSFSAATSSGTSSSVSNSAVVTFPEAGGSWGRVAYLGIRDAATGGNLLYYGALSTALDVLTGTTPKFEAGTLTVFLE